MPARGPLDYQPQHDETGIGIAMLGSRIKEQRLFPECAIRLLFAPLVMAALDVVRQAAAMKEQLVHGDLAKPRIGDPRAARWMHIAEHVDQASVEIERPLFDELEHADAGDRLGDAGQAEERLVLRPVAEWPRRQNRIPDRRRCVPDRQWPSMRRRCDAPR